MGSNRREKMANGWEKAAGLGRVWVGSGGLAGGWW